VFTEQHTIRLAHRASIRIDSAQITQFTSQINDFVAMVSPILSIETKIEPLTSITSKINAIPMDTGKEEQPIEPVELNLVKKTQGYYHVK
jgi:Asp-tRNA(Asn)/Glu-tRNA(Gln) amidotransferase C subunit